MMAGLSILALSACFPNEEPDSETASGSGSSNGPGAQFTPPAVITDAEAFRIAQQATFGASPTDLDGLKNAGFDA